MVRRAPGVGAEGCVSIQDQNFGVGPGKGDAEGNVGGLVLTVGQVDVQVSAGREGAPMPEGGGGGNDDGVATAATDQTGGLRNGNQAAGLPGPRRARTMSQAPRRMRMPPPNPGRG